VSEVSEDVPISLDRVEGVPNWLRRESVQGMLIYAFNQNPGDATEVEDDI
jgi:hypothetical protein